MISLMATMKRESGESRGVLTIAVRIRRSSRSVQIRVESYSDVLGPRDASRSYATVDETCVDIRRWLEAVTKDAAV
jgi:hypothetical protein